MFPWTSMQVRYSCYPNSAANFIYKMPLGLICVQEKISQKIILLCYRCFIAKYIYSIFKERFGVTPFQLRQKRIELG